MSGGENEDCCQANHCGNHHRLQAEGIHESHGQYIWSCELVDEEALLAEGTASGQQHKAIVGQNAFHQNYF
jgi:hypothetical protein